MRQDLHNWLSPPDSSTNHNIACNAHHDGTATWFFKGSMFEEWRSTPSLLWIHGKLMISSGIIEDIKSLQETGSAYLAYFYCDFRDKDKQSRRNLVFSILWQLAVQSDLCCDYLSRLYSEHDRGKRKPSDGTLSRCLKEMLLLPTQGSIYVIIDALDECPNTSGMPIPREEVLDFVQDLVNLHLPNLHLCVTSRPEIDIRTTIEPLTSRCVSLHNQSGQTKDIVDYISSIVYSDRMIQRWRDEEKILVINTLSERANGMFRWVYCQLETLRQCLPPSVRRTLDELPETLDETYEQVLKTVKKVNREHAIRLLHCMTVAIRPLGVEELAEILTVDFDAAQQGDIPKLNPNWRWTDHHQAVLSTCSSLIMIVDDGDSQVVQFSHFSVKEYLTSDRLANASRDVSCYHILPEYAHTILAQACLGVLLRLDDHVTKENAKDTPLANYAAEHWVDHARFKDVPSRVQDTVEVFLDADKPHHAACLRLHPIYEGDGWFQFTDDSMPRGGPLYYASFYGFYDLAKHLAVKHPEHVNARGGPLVSPLAAALYREHFEVAELLHEHGADVNVRSNDESIFVDTARWLLNHGADANAQKNNGWTPLHLAAWNKHLDIVQMLLDHNADIHSQNVAGEVALHLAACYYNDVRINILRLLLDKGADVNATDNEGSTPLHHSSFRKGSVEGTRLLLEHGANIDAENNKGETPFQVAMKEGHHEMVEFLWGLGTMFS
ncbi:ankyrin repeat-containing domain protein [Russula aff. rugulosa BPL654]|nr:ankyrin repeat-containing domain protein [Russula aff. rugulosa BPL654]